jgi:glycosyltransferase involved in cell wall biosynthesis
VIRGSRATLFPSLGEGFGLPPLESLALGVPVIVASQVPSLGLIAPGGQVRLDRPDAQGIRAAVLDMLDDATARRKCQEITGLSLPRWADLGRACADWLAPATHHEPALTPPGSAAA